jgi:hypothetical protein
MKGGFVGGLFLLFNILKSLIYTLLLADEVCEKTTLFLIITAIAFASLTATINTGYLHAD